jgi:hypothetical protein
MSPGGIVRLETEGGGVAGEERVVSDLGRVRDAAVDLDGSALAIADYEDARSGGSRLRERRRTDATSA